MSDLSEFENKYFIDYQRYNCPFCNVRAASYSVIDNTTYNKDSKNMVYVYLVKCDLCGGTSIHLSDFEWECFEYNTNKRRHNPFYSRPGGFDTDNLDYDDFKYKLDLFFFYHYPTSFFTIDERIPKAIRELVSEAEGCKEMNFLVGASGALRKAIYKLLKHEKAIGDNYEDKVKWLKTKYPRVDGDYIDAIGQIKDMNDQDLHEEDWEPFKGPEFDYLVESLKEILNEIYIAPLLRKGRKDKINAMKSGRKKVEDSEEKTPEKNSEEKK